VHDWLGRVEGLQGIGDAVVVPEELHRVVDVDAGPLPFENLIPGLRQRFQGLPFQGLKPRLPGAFEFLEGTVVEVL